MAFESIPTAISKIVSLFGYIIFGTLDFFIRHKYLTGSLIIFYLIVRIINRKVNKKRTE